MTSTLKKFENIRLREHPANSEENFDSVIFSLPSVEDSQAVLSALKKNNLGTKNIPDALRWHFTGMWEHIVRKEELASWPTTNELLSRSIALPVTTALRGESLKKYIEALSDSLGVVNERLG